jgi:undecaprenyl-diphosphatase
LLAVLGIVLCAWVFVETADEVVEGEATSLERQILLALRAPDDLTDPIGPPWLEEVMRDATALGGNGLLTLATLLAAGALLLARRPAAACALVAAIGLGMAASVLLKAGFDRPRPDLVPHGSIVSSPSFPSGHSMLSALTYLTLAAHLARQTTRRSLKVYFFAAALFMTFSAGISRVYLGVHWPTDVLAGWAAGALWALLCLVIVRQLQRYGRVEAASEPTAPPTQH